MGLSFTRLSRSERMAPGARHRQQAKQPLMRRQCQVRLRQNCRRAPQEPGGGRRRIECDLVRGKVRGTALSSERTMTRPDLEGPRTAAQRRNLASRCGRQAGCVRGAVQISDSEGAFLSGCVAQVASLREFDIRYLPEELGWLSSVNRIMRWLVSVDEV
jgi:hypothetical protein